MTDAAEKKETISSGDWTGSEELLRGYNPTIGGSFALIPKLEGKSHFIVSAK